LKNRLATYLKKRYICDSKPKHDMGQPSYLI